MRRAVLRTASEVLAMVLCPSAALVGPNADPALLVPMKAAIIRRFHAERSRGARS